MWTRVLNNNNRVGQCNLLLHPKTNGNCGQHPLIQTYIFFQSISYHVEILFHWCPQAHHCRAPMSGMSCMMQPSFNKRKINQCVHQFPSHGLPYAPWRHQKWLMTTIVTYELIGYESYDLITHSSMWMTCCSCNSLSTLKSLVIQSIKYGPIISYHQSYDESNIFKTQGFLQESHALTLHGHKLF